MGGTFKDRRAWLADPRADDWFAFAARRSHLSSGGRHPFPQVYPFGSAPHRIIQAGTQRILP